jgi:hypothetical protein
MALVGTISGSNGTSTTAISGTLVIADSPASVFPMLPADVKFFVSGVQGAIASSLPGVAVFGGDLRVSGSSYFTDIDVTGHGAVVVHPYGTSAGQTGEVRFKELAANGGNYTALKAADSIAANLHITLPNAAGSNGNVLQTNGSGVTSFVDASSVVTGALSLVSINASSNITGSNALLSGDLAVGGRTTLAGVTERMTHTQGGSTLTCDMTGSSIFYLNKPSGDVTANFTNVPTTNNRIITPTVILSQSSPAYIVSIVQVDGAGQTINWANGTTPTGTANKQDVFGFSLIRSGSAWKVLGQMSTYG